jgi:phosphoenolpyruvate carboxylase
VAIPASALQADAQVWLADGDVLRIQRVEPRYIDRDRIYLAESDALIRFPVITSTLSNAQAGMPIETIGQQNASAD